MTSLVKSSPTFLIVLTLALHLPLAWSQKDVYQPSIPAKSVVDMEQARQLRLAGNAIQSIAILEPVVGANPDYFSAAYNAGLAYSDLHQYDKAVETLSKARQIREKSNLSDATIYNSLGYTLILAGYPRQAEEVFLEGLKHENLLTVDSKRRLYNNLGNLYLNVGKYAEAEKYLADAAEKYQSDVARNNLRVLRAARNISIQQQTNK